MPGIVSSGPTVPVGVTDTLDDPVSKILYVSGYRTRFVLYCINVYLCGHGAVTYSSTITQDGTLLLVSDPSSHRLPL